MGKKKVIYISEKKTLSRGIIDGRDWKWRIWPFTKEEKPRRPVNAEEVPSEREKGLIDDTERCLAEIAEEWHKKDDPLSKEYCNTKGEIERLNERLNKEKKEHKKASNEYDTAKKKFSIQSMSLMSPLVAHIFIGMLSFGEFAFNIMAFGIFAQPQLETIILSLGIGFAIPTVAYFCGSTLRNEIRPMAMKIMGVASVLIMFGVFWVLAVLREKYIEATETMNLLNIQLSKGTLLWNFIIINTVFFLAIVILTYLSSHKNPEAYKKARKGFEDASKSLKKEGVDVDIIEKQLEVLKKKLSNVSVAREKMFKQFVQRAEQEKNVWERLIRAYREGNLSVRPDNPYLNKPFQEIKLPEVFNELSWECPMEKK